MLALAAAAAAVTPARRAEACAGAFVPPAEVSVVTDHRIAFSIAPQQTILWDQMQYSGDPREFAWVLPVKAGAKIELSNDELFDALDASTRPIVYAPQEYDNGGCTLNCAGGAAFDDGSAGSAGRGVEILSQSVVGPYEQVTLRSSDDDALVDWLRSNQFFIPTSIEPMLAAYVEEGFDFIALKLRPECGQRAMRPVRVVSPGAIPSLPLRMVAAGVGASVGITLYVISEGKYQPQNFPHLTIPDQRLRWDRGTNKSNYEPLSQELMAQAEGRTWIIEYADKPQTPLRKGWQDPNQLPSDTSTSRTSVGLASAYYGACKYWSGYRPNDPYSPYSPSSSSSGGGGTCPEPDAGLARRDDNDNDNDNDDDDDQTSSSSSSGYSPYLPRSNPERDCAYLDDLDAAFEGLHYENVWVTRMRSNLPVNALTTDLVVEPSKLPDGRADTEAVSNFHWTPYYTDDDNAERDVKGNCAGSPRRSPRPYASYTALAIFGGAVAITLARRHRRPKR